MNNLIKVKFENDRPTVSGRELHDFLEVGTEYRHWFPRMCEYGFTDGIDYTPVIFDHPQNHQPITDHQLTIEMAKEICMLQRNERGKQARQYFIQLEKLWNTPEQVMARALKMADQQIQEAHHRIYALEQTVEQQRSKVMLADAITGSAESMLIGEFVRFLTQNGMNIGRNRFFEVLRDSGLLCKSESLWNKPTQLGMNLGLFELREHLNGNGSVCVTTTLVTPKGQEYFIARYLYGKSVDIPLELKGA